MAANLAFDKFWMNKVMYHDAEKKYQESLAKLQRRLEILGGMKEEINNKKMNTKTIQRNKKMHNEININELRKQLFNLEAQENTKNKTFQCKTHSFDLIKEKADCDFEKNEDITDNEEKNWNKKQEKGKREKKYLSEKKPKRTKENEDKLLGGVGMTKINQDAFPKTSLAGEVAKARQHIKTSLECMENINGVGNMTSSRLTTILEKMEKVIENLTKRVEALEQSVQAGCPRIAVCPAKPPAQTNSNPPAEDNENENVDLFGSDSEEDEEAKKIREQRLAEYAAKKSKKPAVVAKSNIILDIKPWDDETDMKEMEKAVRAIEMDGLIWGASKLVPVAFKIFKLQISCVIEDEKVSVDLLTEKLEKIEDYIQSVDIAAFNKV